MAKQIKAGREERSSALWGTTKRDGDSKGSALWGNGGRGGALLLALLTALMIPLAAGASQSSSPSTSSSGQGSGSDPSVAIPEALLSQAKSNPQDTFRVIVQGASNDDAAHVAKDVAQIAAQSDPKLAAAAKKADEGVQRALDRVDRLVDRAAKARSDAAKAKTDAALKAARALLTGRAAHRDAAKKGADDAARKAAEATKAVQDLQDARPAANLADDNAHEAQANVSDSAKEIREEQITDEFDSISGVAASLTGAQVARLAANGGDLTAITPDVPVQETVGPRWSSSQAWVTATGAEPSWAMDRDPAIASRMPAIAIVDSGIENRSDFGDRLIASVNLSRLPNNSPGDGRGHGTFVAGIAAGSNERYTGTAPAAKLVSVDVLDDNGMGRTSDVIRAAQWILDNKAKYNIRVANFSLHSQIEAPFYLDPLDQAVEQLWFNGVVVVAAAGNYGTENGPSGVRYSPANDPFVITVGAADLGTRADTRDDGMAPWSAWGSTMDGFAKPELSAPGRYMIAPVPQNSTLVSERPSSVTAPGYMRLSGTSFAAPVVSGAAAVILANNPNLTPDQVKGALMLTATSMDDSIGFAGGVGKVAVDRAIDQTDPPNPNAGLSAFVKKLPGKGSILLFDSASWRKAAKGSASWNSASWNSASWNSASWNSASWNSASWNSASWNSASWNSASWNSASWNSASWNSGSREDAVGLDGPQ